MKELTSDSFDEAAQGTVLVDFWAPWCGPCRQVAPVFEKLSKEFTSVVFAKVNVDEQQELAQQHDVMGIPCMILLHKSAEVARFVGALPEASLRSKLKKELEKVSV